MKNEAKAEESVEEESGGEEEATDGNLEASTVTATTLPQAQKFQQPLIASEDRPVLVSASAHEMFMSSDTTGEVQDGQKHEIVSMKDKYAGKVVLFSFFATIISTIFLSLTSF